MLKRTVITAICIILMLILPMIAMKNGIQGKGGPDAGLPESKPPAHSDEKSGSDNEGADKDFFIIRDKNSGRITKVDDRTFCIGALAWEMHPGFEHEALCAQVVALYSHFCYLRNDSRRKGREYDLEGEEGAAPYLDDQTLKSRFGSSYDDCMVKLCTAVDEVFGYVLTLGDKKPIDAAYFAMSSGRTEDAADVFGRDYPCLVSAASPWDMLEDDYITTVKVTKEEFEQKLPGAQKNADGSFEIGQAKRTSPGTVAGIVIGKEEFTGAQLRSIFGLRSACFDLEREGENYVFAVRGYGHGVGMSQCGADSMAKQGASWREIISHYYPGSTAETIGETE